MSHKKWNMFFVLLCRYTLIEGGLIKSYMYSLYNMYMFLLYYSLYYMNSLYHITHSMYYIKSSSKNNFTLSHCLTLYKMILPYLTYMQSFQWLTVWHQNFLKISVSSQEGGEIVSSRTFHTRHCVIIY